MYVFAENRPGPTNFRPGQFFLNKMYGSARPGRPGRWAARPMQTSVEYIGFSIAGSVEYYYLNEESIVYSRSVMIKSRAENEELEVEYHQH